MCALSKTFLTADTPQAVLTRPLVVIVVPQRRIPAARQSRQAPRRAALPLKRAAEQSEPGSVARLGPARPRFERPARHNRCSIHLVEDNMPEEKKITETTTKTKDDLFGNPKEQETTTTERQTKSDAFGNEKQTETTVERKEKEEE